jgi:hypothetical protein
VGLLDAVSGEQMRTARIVAGATMAAFIAVGLAPPLRPYARTIRLTLVAVYLLGCAGFVAYVLLR